MRRWFETVSTHSRPKAAAGNRRINRRIKKVSTHSRPKAAAPFYGCQIYLCFQFQHTAARRRLQLSDIKIDAVEIVSTHSRPKAAASEEVNAWAVMDVSTHSRPKAAARFAVNRVRNCPVSTHSRPKAAAFRLSTCRAVLAHCFNTQPPEGGCQRKPCRQ